MIRAVRQILASVATAALVLPSLTPVSAQVAGADACSAERIVFYVNGVRTTHSEAMIERQILAQRLGAADAYFTESGRVVLKYNSTFRPDLSQAQQAYLTSTFGGTVALALANGFGSTFDFLEAIVQDTALEELDALRLFALDRLSTYQPNGRTIPAGLLNDFRTALNLYLALSSLSLAASIEYLADTGDLRDITSDLREATSRGQKVVVVAYSQGNYFANLAYGRLTTAEKLSVGIVGVGAPTAPTSGQNAYFLFNTDQVIGGVSGVTSFANLITSLNLTAPPPANATNGNPNPSDLGHAFADYMHPGSASAAGIVSAVLNQFNALTPPIPTIGTGILQATLTWGAQPDVDLHVYEPGGTHVFYGNFGGVSGSLDRDDVTSFGPENYVVLAQNLQLGTYRIGVNYYSGSGPETATVSVCAAGQIRTFQTPLTTAVGSAGDNSPIPVATVSVASVGGATSLSISTGWPAGANSNSMQIASQVRSRQIEVMAKP